MYTLDGSKRGGDNLESASFWRPNGEMLKHVEIDNNVLRCSYVIQLIKHRNRNTTSVKVFTELLSKAFQTYPTFRKTDRDSKSHFP